MNEVVTYSAAILGIVYTIINSFIIWDSVGMELKGFVSAKTKANLILSTIILSFMLIMIVAYYLFEFEKTSNEFEKTILVILISIMSTLTLFSIPLL
ncbi:hypothetical protein M0910_001935, partial [Listeria monocytogenes]|nr:hypothetical protein [Listeria monocytogenes]